MNELSTYDNGITIVKLGPGQSVKATCIATLVRTAFLVQCRVRACVCEWRCIPVCRLCFTERCRLGAPPPHTVPRLQGIGKMHYKWSPVGTCVFKVEYDIRLNPGAYGSVWRVVYVLAFLVIWHRRGGETVALCCS